MLQKLLVIGVLLVLQQTFKDSFSSPLQSFDVFDFLGKEENFEVHKRSDPVDDSDCKDLREDCDKIALEGEELSEYCEQWKNDDAVSQCKKTCGWCKTPSPAVCEDERDDCQWIVDKVGQNLDEYCQQHKHDPAVKDCSKTCGFCKKIPFPPEIPFQSPAPQTFPKVTKKHEPKPTDEPQGVQPTWFQKECLAAHNKYRALHGSPPLKWSAELSSEAQAWADKLARDDEMYHYPGLTELDEGENLAYFSPPNKKCNGPSEENCVHCGEIVKDWYDEVVDYDFSQGKAKLPFYVVTHFTQVVWKGTTELGMATAVGHDRFVSVARYRKRGNGGSSAEFKKNVLRSKDP